MALAAWGIVTVANMKSYLKIESTRTEFDSQIETWINNYSAHIEQFLGGKVVSQDCSGEIYNGTGTNELCVRHKPIIQIGTQTTPTEAEKLASVQYRGDPNDTWHDIETDGDMILIDNFAPYKIILFQNAFPSGLLNIKVSYKAGYASGTATLGAIEQLVYEKIGTQWQKTQTLGSNAPNFIELSKDDMAKLSMYRWAGV